MLSPEVRLKKSIGKKCNINLWVLVESFLLWFAIFYILLLYVIDSAIEKVKQCFFRFKYEQKCKEGWFKIYFQLSTYWFFTCSQHEVNCSTLNTVTKSLNNDIANLRRVLLKKNYRKISVVSISREKLRKFQQYKFTS